MKLLLDTHVLLWALKGRNTKGELFPPNITDIILDENNEIYYSSVNIFEVEIKRIVRPQDNLPTGEELIGFCGEAGFISLPLRSQHTLQMKNIKKDEVVADHKDPYDWLLIAQAKSENMKLITHDSKLKYYLEDCIISF